MKKKLYMKSISKTFIFCRACLHKFNKKFVCYDQLFLNLFGTEMFTSLYSFIMEKLLNKTKGSRFLKCQGPKWSRWSSIIAHHTCSNISYFQPPAVIQEPAVGISPVCPRGNNMYNISNRSMHRKSGARGKRCWHGGQLEVESATRPSSSVSPYWPSASLWRVNPLTTKRKHCIQHSSDQLSLLWLTIVNKVYRDPTAFIS